MQLHTLRSVSGIKKKKKRIGRGQGSGKGGTATKGHKGAKARSGYKRKFGFEGGQLPLQRRIPKFGFKNPFTLAYKPINLSLLQQLLNNTPTLVIDSMFLLQNGVINKNKKYKILGKLGIDQGVLPKGLEVHAHAFSQSAIKAIQDVGGKVVVLSKV